VGHSERHICQLPAAGQEMKNPYYVDRNKHFWTLPACACRAALGLCGWWRRQPI